MWKLLRFLKPYRKESICAPLFKLLEVVFELLVPLVVAHMIDSGIGEADQGIIIHSALLMITLGAIGLASATTAQYFAARASAGFGANIRYAMMQHIQKRSYAELDQMGTNTMITRITSDVNQVQSGVNMALRLVMRSPFVVIGAMIMAFTVDVKCALIFAAVIPLLTIVVFAIMFGSIPLYQNVQKKLDGILGRTRENLLGVRVLRAFRKEQEEIDAFTQESVELSVLQKRVGRISALMNPATYILLNLAIVFLIWVGALQVNVGVLTQGAIIALYNYMSQILVELIKLANLIITLTKSIASGNRMPDKFARSGLTAVRSEKVDAPVIQEFPLTLECRVVEDKMEVFGHHILGEIVGVLADEDVLDEAGNVDAKKLNALVYDQRQGSYYTIGEKAGKAWSAGAHLMKNEE